MAGHIGVLRLLEGPLDRGGRVRVAHQGLGGRLEGERHEFGAPVPAARGELRRVGGLLAGLGEVAVHHHLAPGELVVDQREQPGVVTGVGQHLREDRVDLAERLPGRLDDHHPRPYPFRRHRRPRQHLPGYVPGQIDLARRDGVLGGLEPPLVRCRIAVGGGVPGGEQPERGGDRGRPAVPGQRRGLGEPGRHLRVGAGGGQRQVPGPLDGVGGRRRQRRVHGPALGRGRLRVEGGRDQRVREAQGGLLRVRRQQAERGGLGRLRLGVVPAGRVQQRQGGAGARAGHQQGAARLVRQHLQPAEHQGPQRRRHRQRLAGTGPGGALREGAAQLQREQRVAGAGAVDVTDRGAGQTRVAPVVEQRRHLGAGERAQAHRERVRRAGAQMTVVVVLLAVRAHRAQHPHRAVAEPPGGEAEELRAGRVQPLQVVGDDEDRALGGQRAQCGQHRQAQRQPVPLERGLAAPGERRLQRGALGGGQPAGHLVDDQTEQVRQRQERKMRFGLRGRAAQHRPRGTGVFRRKCPQHGRFSYSGGPVEQHAAPSGELLPGVGEQLLPANDQVGAVPGRLLEVPSHGHRSPP